MNEDGDTVTADAVQMPAVAQPKTTNKEFGRDLAVATVGASQVPMPSNYAQMKDMASMMAQGGAMVGKAFRNNPGACMAIITQAMRWGMDPYMVSLKSYVASADGDGPIAYEAQLVSAVIHTSPMLTKRLRCSYDGDGDARTVTIVGWLKGEDEPFEYKSPKLIGIKKKSPLWVADPDQQLFYYGVRAWARKWVPEIIMGVYTPEEMLEATTFGGTPVDQGASQNVRLSDLDGGGEQPKDADFTDVGDQLARKAAAKTETKKPAKTKAAAKAPPEKETAATGEGSGREEASRVSVAVEAADPKTDTAAEGDGSQTDPTDDQIVATVEKLHAEAKGAGKVQPIIESRGALERIAETSDDEQLAARAAKLLNKYDLPPVK